MIYDVEYQKQNWKQISCDNCGEILQDDERGYNLMPDEVAIHNLANEESWEILSDGEVHYCPNCIINEEE